MHQDAQPITEQTNPATATIDALSAAEIIDLISTEDQKPAQLLPREDASAGEQQDSQKPCRQFHVMPPATSHSASRARSP